MACAGGLAGEGAMSPIDRRNGADQVADAEFAGDRFGDETVGGGDDGAQVASSQVFKHRGTRALTGTIGRM